MKQKIYQVDAFTTKLFGGNPAAVCPLASWLSDETMQNIAMENNLAETAFYINEGDHYLIRWFTPSVEVDLCGHATLATAYVLFNLEAHQGNEITFISERSGILKVTKDTDILTLDFPVDIPVRTETDIKINSCFNIHPVEVLRGRNDLLLVYNEQSDIEQIVPDLKKLAFLDCRGVIVTAGGKDSDFVSRFFAPQSGIDEDPVTGSAHTTLTPYWASRTGKSEFTAVQLSGRKGYLSCRLEGERVKISGTCKLYLTGYLSGFPE
jgi:PhzF family phenazine biosynthesis protein